MRLGHGGRCRCHPRDRAVTTKREDRVVLFVATVPGVVMAMVVVRSVAAATGAATGGGGGVFCWVLKYRRAGCAPAIGYSAEFIHVVSCGISSGVCSVDTVRKYLRSRGTGVIYTAVSDVRLAQNVRLHLLSVRGF